MKRHFVVLGGDKRSLELVNLLQSDGHIVRNLVGDDGEALAFNHNEIVIGPLPFSHDNKTLDAPFHRKKLVIEDVFSNMRNNQYFIAGKIHEDHISKAKAYGIKLIDFFKREEMQVLNAIPTAEAAIQVAMENLSITIHSSNILVLGYGRIGKVLSNLSYNLGANTYVAARKFGDIAWIKNLKYNSIQFEDVDKYLNTMDVVFNTIPSTVLTEKNLKKFRKESLIIDLASHPGGIDYNAAKDLGINVIHALGLPGKYSPVSAANIIKETIYNIIEERGM